MAEKLVFLSPVCFDRMKQRHQSFAIELARMGFDVSFVDPVCSPGYSVAVEEKFQNLKVYRIRIPFKASAVACLQNVAAKMALSLLLKNSELVAQQTVLWVAEPSLAAFLQFRWQTVIYDRCDLHGAFPGQRLHTWRSYEESICASADLISVSHPYLAENLPEIFSDKIVLAPNACSSEFLENGTVKWAAERTVSGNIIRLVSSGAHYEWADIDWLNMIADLEGVELHIAGTGRGKAFEKLLNRDNVVFHGHLKHESLIRLLKDCHVGLIPFRNIELIKAVDPVKAYEYAACGLEIWAPDLLSLHANNFVGRFISQKSQAVEALQAFQRSPVIFSEKIPLWSERLQTILDRFHALQSD